MDIKTETLVILMEECGEVIQECSKILRFGNDAEKLHKELGDLFCMIKLTEDNLNLDFNKTFEYSTNKYNKLKNGQIWSAGQKRRKLQVNEGTSLIVSIVLFIGNFLYQCEYENETS